MADNAQQKPAQRGEAPFSENKSQRKTILIKKKLQYRYMALIFMSVLVAFVIVGLDLMWTISKVVTDHPMMQPLLEDMFGMAPLFIVKIGMYLVIVLIMAAVVSHRMAGPVYKFEKSCATVASGDLTHRVCLRKGDQLTELQDRFNHMTAAVNEVVKQLEAFKAQAAAESPSLKLRADEVSAKISGIMPGYKI
ncbi:MAG: methyl-accepting chemotaxis protein [Elusimicrobiales bacterium]|jgi:nitrogen fixation/metabolism regulation signal transduction histidine kinase